MVRFRRKRQPRWATLICALALCPATATGQDALPEPEELSERYGDWIVTCSSTQNQGDRMDARLCEMTQTLRQQDDGKRVLSVAMQPETDVVDTALVTMITPFGLDVTDQIGIRVNDLAVLEAPFQTCVPAGCIVQARLEARSLAVLRGGETATVNLPTRAGETFAVTLSLRGFGTAWNRLNEL